MKKLFLSALMAFALPVIGHPDFDWEVGTTVLPTTATPLAGTPGIQTVHAGQLNISNVSGSTVNVYLLDNSTNCNSGPCTIWSAPIASSPTTYTVNLRGQKAVGGLSWYASSSNSVHAWISGRF